MGRCELQHLVVLGPGSDEARANIVSSEEHLKRTIEGFQQFCVLITGTWRLRELKGSVGSNQWNNIACSCQNVLGHESRKHVRENSRWRHEVNVLLPVGILASSDDQSTDWPRQLFKLIK